MNELDLVEDSGPRSLGLSNEQLLPVLRSSLYPGAADASIALVLAYCRASGLDPMQKPVHIVPMLVKTGAKDARGYDVKEWRDVIMPGIGLYRVQASRTGQLAGIDEPVFGPSIPMPGVPSAMVPESCRVTVHRMVGGRVASFAAVEYWVENYTTAGKDTDAPNAMWRRRSRGQIAKCAEAQALRKAFPELGSQPTADETIVDLGDEGAPPAPPVFAVARKPAPALAAPQEAATAASPPPSASTTPPKEAAAPVADPGVLARALVGAGEIAYLRNKAKAAGVDLASVLADMGGLVLEKLTRADFALVKARLQEVA